MGECRFYVDIGDVRPIFVAVDVMSLGAVHTREHRCGCRLVNSVGLVRRHFITVVALNVCGAGGFVSDEFGVEILASDERAVAVLFAVEVRAQGEDVVGVVFVHRGIGGGAYYNHCKRRIANQYYRHAEQDGVQDHFPFFVGIIQSVHQRAEQQDYVYNRACIVRCAHCVGE